MSEMDTDQTSTAQRKKKTIVVRIRHSDGCTRVDGVDVASMTVQGLLEKVCEKLGHSSEGLQLSIQEEASGDASSHSSGNVRTLGKRGGGTERTLSPEQTLEKEGITEQGVMLLLGKGKKDKKRRQEETVGALMSLMGQDSSEAEVQDLINRTENSQKQDAFGKEFFEAKSIYFVGPFSSDSTENVKEAAKRVGAKVCEELTKDTDFVIVGNGLGPGQTKLRLKRNADSLGVKVWDEGDFMANYQIAAVQQHLGCDDMTAMLMVGTKSFQEGLEEQIQKDQHARLMHHLLG